jgi:hypothetical protein
MTKKYSKNAIRALAFMTLINELKLNLMQLEASVNRYFDESKSEGGDSEKKIRD